MTVPKADQISHGADLTEADIEQVKRAIDVRLGRRPLAISEKAA